MISCYLVDMNISIRRYNEDTDYDGLTQIIAEEGEEWKEYLSSEYRFALKNSITYVAYHDHDLCGYSRSWSDFGFHLWILDLLVAKRFRGLDLGKKLMEEAVKKHTNAESYVLSDADGYYQKQGYENVGSIFKVVVEGKMKGTKN